MTSGAMNMLNKLKQIFQNNIDQIYYLGVFDSDDKEFIISGNYLFFELEGTLIGFDRIKGEGKLCITLPQEITNKILLSDANEGKVGVEDIVFHNYLFSDRKVVRATFYNLRIDATALYTDALMLELADGQILFVDPEISGITIGGTGQKEYWLKI